MQALSVRRRVEADAFGVFGVADFDRGVGVYFHVTGAAEGSGPGEGHAGEGFGVGDAGGGAGADPVAVAEDVELAAAVADGEGDADMGGFGLAGRGVGAAEQGYLEGVVGAGDHVVGEDAERRDLVLEEDGVGVLGVELDAAGTVVTPYPRQWQ